MKKQIGLLTAVIIIVWISTSFSIVENRGIRQAIAGNCGSIEGRVLDKNGLPVSGAKVYSEATDHPSGPNSARASSETDSKGRFFIGCAEPGRNGVGVTKEDEYY